MGKPCLFQRQTDKGHIVGGTAAAAGLGHEDGQPIGVVLARKNGIHDLPDGNQRRVAGIVVDKLEAHIHGTAVIAVQQDDVVARLVEHRFKQLEVDGRHLRTEKRIAGLLHLAGELDPVVGSEHRSCHNAVFLAHPDGRNQRADADARCTEVVDLVDLEQSVELSRLGEVLGHLVSGDGVHTAAKGVELHQIEVIETGAHRRLLHTVGNGRSTGR